MGYEHALSVESHRNPAPTWATVLLATAVVTVGLAVVLQIWMTSFSISADTCHYSPTRITSLPRFTILRGPHS